MPHNWLKLSNTPPPWDEVSQNPVKYREAVEKTVAYFGGRVIDMYWAVSEHHSYVLVDGPNDPVKLKALARALPSIAIQQVLDVKEAQRAFDLARKAPKPPQTG